MILQETDCLGLLTLVPNFGPVRIRKLVDYFGSAVEALQQPWPEVARCLRLKMAQPSDWPPESCMDVWMRHREAAKSLGVQLIAWGSPHYPVKLLALDDRPPLIYVQGCVETLSLPGVAIVGTRTPSIYGTCLSQQTAKELARHQCTVISGLARGIDTAAHHGALESGVTIAVIGSGHADMYPKENLALSKKIALRGAVVSESPPLTPPDRTLFPRRNRLIAALSLGVILVEAPEKSGAMLTMAMAKEQHKKCFAFPGRVDVETFKGNHLCIKTHQASLIEKAADVLNAMPEVLVREEIPDSVRSKQLTNVNLEPSARQVLQLLKGEEKTIEQIGAHLGWPIPKVTGMMMTLTLKKLVREFPGRRYKVMEGAAV